MAEIGFLRLKDVLKLYPVSKTAWYVGIADGKHPKPLKLNPRTSAWKRSEIVDLLERTSAGGAL